MLNWSKGKGRLGYMVADHGQPDPHGEWLCDQRAAEAEDQAPVTSGFLPIMAALRFEVGYAAR